MSTFAYNNYWKRRNFHECADFAYKWPCLKKYIPSKPKLKILDFGCGAGQIIEQMCTINPSSTYYGVDVSTSLINNNKKKFPECQFRTIRDGERLPFSSNFFDFILAADSIEHVHNTEIAFTEFARILKPKGRIVITTPYHGLIKNLMIILTNNFDLIFNPLGTHIRFFTKKSLSKCLSTVALKTTRIDYYGRFYPLSRGMLIEAEKSNRS